MSELIISVSGLRGIVGDALTPDVAMRFAGAFAMGLPEGPVVVTRDSRRTGQMLEGAVNSALCAAGRDVICAGIAATPTTGILVKTLEAAGGIQISASHNPPEYNGLKLFADDGTILTAQASEAVAGFFRAGTVRWIPHDRVGSVRGCPDTLEEHLARILATVDVDRIRRRRFRVVVDANHGVASLLASRLLDVLECETTFVGREPNGNFLHRPEPTRENLVDVCALVPRANADVGFCPDPDADRLAVLDENGRYIGEEYTLPLCVSHVLSRRAGTVVTNCASSRMSEDVAAEHGASLVRSRVGEANVVAEMKKHNAVFGGEGNGGPIDPRVGYVRDSFVGMALILDAMADGGVRMSQLADALPRYAIQKEAISFDRDKLSVAVERLNHHFPDAKLDSSAGLRFNWDDRWLLLHPSNTEPVVRIIAEARSENDARNMCQETVELLESI